jgi:hypothetical protein
MDDLLYRALKFLEGVGSGTNTDARIFCAEEAAAGRQPQSPAGNGALQRIDHVQIPEAPRGMLLLKASCGLLEFTRAGIHDQESFGPRKVQAHLPAQHRPAVVRHENIQGMERVGHHLASGWRILDGAWVYKSDGDYGTTEAFQSSVLKENATLTIEQNRVQCDLGRPIFQGLTCLTTSMTLPSR